MTRYGPPREKIGRKLRPPKPLYHLSQEWMLTVDSKALTAWGRVKPIAIIIPIASSLTADNPDAPLPGILNGALKSKKYKMNWGGAQLRISIDLKATKVNQSRQILLRESYMIYWKRYKRVLWKSLKSRISSRRRQTKINDLEEDLKSWTKLLGKLRLSLPFTSSHRKLHCLPSPSPISMLKTWFSNTVLALCRHKATLDERKGEGKEKLII